jgi:DNA-binding MarR family transcriptional regulator
VTSQVLTTQTSPTVAVWSRLLRTHAALSRDLNAQLVADHGLTINDYEALLHLSHAENRALRRVDLAERLMLTPSGVTRLLDGLERDGWVTKGQCESDARVTYAVLTDAGHERLEAAARSHLAQVRSVFEERLSAQELATLAGLLGRLPGGGADDDESCSPGESGTG